VAALANAVFAGQLKVEVDQPMLLKPMLNICDLKDQIQDLS